MNDLRLSGIQAEIENFLSCIRRSTDPEETRVHTHALANALQALFLHIELKSYAPKSTDLLRAIMDEWEGDYGEEALEKLAWSVDESLGDWLFEKGKIYHCECGRSAIEEEHGAKHRNNKCRSN